MATSGTNASKTLKLCLTAWYNRYPQYSCLLADRLKRKGKLVEADYRDDLALIISGKSEVKTPIGRIDLLCDSFMLIIEVKFYTITSFKHAIGQAICYLAYYPAYSPAIAMINTPKQAKFIDLCDQWGITYLAFWNGRWQI